MPSKVVAITGASAGVGRATARSFAQRGYSVALIARGKQGLESVAKETDALGAPTLPLQLDVADASAVQEAATVIEAALGPLDVWVNNAMATIFSPFTRVSAAEFQRATEVTYLGAVNGTRAALNRMTRRDCGTIVQVGSALAYRGIPLQSAYCGAKHALKGFSESLRTELLHDGSAVWVTMVQLPALNTPQFEWSRSKMRLKPQPVPPIYQPEIAAQAIFWAAHHRRRELMVGVPTLITVLGNRFAPGLLMRYLARYGYGSQQTDEPERPRDGNLFSPVEGDFGAHGAFDERSTSRSPHLYLTTHRKQAFALGTSAAALGLAKMIRK